MFSLIWRFRGSCAV